MAAMEPIEPVELVAGPLRLRPWREDEGHLRRSYRYGDGVKHDELLWARLSDDPAPDLSTRS
jgi:hypothetical protein